MESPRLTNRKPLWRLQAPGPSCHTSFTQPYSGVAVRDAAGAGANTRSTSAGDRARSRQVAKSGRGQTRCVACWEGRNARFAVGADIEDDGPIFVQDAR